MALHGSIDSFPIVDVLRLLATTEKSGRLTLDGDRGRGSVWFASGRMVGGEATGLGSVSTPSMDSVIFDLLRFDSGSFEFEADAAVPSPGDPTDVEAAIGVAETMLVEFQEVTAVVPGVDAGLRLIVGEADRQVTFDPHQWAAVVAIGSGATVSAVGSALGLGELESLRTARDLHDLGVVDVTDSVVPAPQAPDTEESPQDEVFDADDLDLLTADEPEAEDDTHVAEDTAQDTAKETAQDTAEETPEETPEESRQEPVEVAAEQRREATGDDLFTESAPGPFSPSPFDRDPVSDDVSEVTPFAMPPASETSADPGTAESSPMSSSSMDDLFGEFDPFGQQSSGDDDLFAPIPEPTAVTGDSPFADVEHPAADDESLQAQMAMLSPAAAAALAAARKPPVSSDESTDDDESGRAAVSNYLGNL